MIARFGACVAKEIQNRKSKIEIPLRWYFQIALRQLFPSGGRFPFFTVVSVVGVMLGVAALVIVQSVMNGFGNEIRRSIVDTSGHLRIQTGGLMGDYRSVMQKVSAMPEVVATAPLAAGRVMVQFQGIPTFPTIEGIDPTLEPQVVQIGRFLRTGRLEDLDDDSVFLSTGLAASLGAYRGGEIEIYSPLILERLQQDEIVLPRRYRVAGIFETGWSQVDENTVVCSLRTMQELYDLHDRVHGVIVRLRDDVDPDEAVVKIDRLLGAPYHAISWIDTNRDFLFVLQLEKNVMFILQLIIVLVASFAITSSMLITVVRKTREIGLFGALGARSREVAWCYCAQGLFLGVTGTVLGFAFAALILFFRNNIIHFFTKITSTEAAMARYYQFSNLPAEYSAKDVVLIATLSIVIATLAGIIPAWRASRLRPSEALRSE